MPKIVRVLSELPLDGKKYQPNALVKLDDKRAKALESAGAVDATAEAVAYCKDELGVEVVEHAPAATPEASTDSQSASQ